jgi:hypothetical protein
LHKENGKYFINCTKCHVEFEVGKNTYYKSDKPHFCPDCRIKNRKPYRGKAAKLLKRTCDECKKEFVMSQQRIEKRLKRYGKNLCTSCSKNGDKNPFYGLRFSASQKQRFSEIRSEYYNDPNFGKQRREEVSIRTTGENNPMYKGAEERSNYTWRNKTFREKVLRRDKNTCAKCHSVNDESNLIAHHKDSCDWAICKRLDIDNGVTLCNDCHKMFHHMYGYGNNTAKQFEEFLQEGSETIESTLDKISSMTKRVE